MKKLFTLLTMLLIGIGSSWADSVISTAVAGTANLQSSTLDVQKSGTSISSVDNTTIISNASGVCSVSSSRTYATIALEINIPTTAPTSFTRLFTWSTSTTPNVTNEGSIGIGIDTNGNIRGTWEGNDWNSTNNYQSFNLTGKHILVITTNNDGTKTYVDGTSDPHQAAGLMCVQKFTNVIISNYYIPYISQIYIFDNTDINIATLINEMQFSSADVTADSNWGDLSFSPAFTDNANARLNFIGDKTVTASSAASINYLTIAGTGNATLATSGENTMTATKSLLVRPTTIGSGINLGSFSYGTNGSLTVDGTSNTVTYPADMIPSSRSKKITFNGSGTFGASISDNAFTSNPITGSWVFSGGSHSLYLYNYNGASQKMGSGATVDNPTIYVKDGATLNLSGKDICGWNHKADVDGIIRIAETSTLNFSNKSGNTLYFSQRLYLQPGSTVNINAEDDKFRMNGGTGESTAQIYMPASALNSSEATISRTNTTGEIYLASDNPQGVAVFVGENSTLNISAPVDGLGRSMVKYGTGTLKLSHNLQNTALTVSAGTLKYAGQHGIWDRTAITVNSGATMLIQVGDPLYYGSEDPGGKCTLNVYGTLDMSSYRLSVGPLNTINAYAGSTITGTGDTYGAIDNFSGATINIKAKEGESAVTWSAVTRPRTNFAFNVEGGVTLNHQGNFTNQGKQITKAGAGTMNITGSFGNNTLNITGGTLKTSVALTVNEINDDATLQIVGGAESPLSITMPSADKNDGTTEILSGIVRIAAGREGTMSVGSGATLQLQVTDAQIAAGYDASAITGEGTVKFFNSLGEEITENVEGKVLKATLNQWTPSATAADNRFNNADRWSQGVVPTSGDITFKIDNDATVLIDVESNISFNSITITTNGGVKDKTLTFQNADGNSNKITTNILMPMVDVNVKPLSGIESTAIAPEANARVIYAPSSNLTVRSSISGAGIVEVASGVVTFGTNNSFTGGLVVKSGAVAKTTVGKGFGDYTNGASIANLKTVTVENGGAVDIANTAGYCYKYTIAGEGVTVNESKSGAMYNSGSDIGTNQRQPTVITLSDDAMVRCDHKWGLLASTYGEAQLNLAGHTITKRGSEDWIICHVSDDDTEGGKIVIEEGKMYTYNTSSDLSAYDVVFKDGGQLSANASVTFKTIEAQSGSTVDFNSYVSVTTAKTTGTGRIQVSDYTANHTTTITTPIIGTAGNKGYIKKVGVGEVVLNNSSNTCGGIEVREGKLTFNNCAEKGIGGTIDIAEGTTLKIGKSDAFDYNGTCTVNIYGTLDMGNARFTVGANNIINAYAGCTIAGTGDGYGAIDNFGGSTMYAKKNGENGGTVTWSANSRFRTNVSFNVEDGVTLNHTGNFMANGSNYYTVTKTGAGAFKFSGNNVGHRYKYSDGAFDVVTVENETETEQIHVKNSETMTVASGYALTYSRTTWIPVYGIAGGGTVTKTDSNATLSINTPDDAGTEGGNFNIIESTMVNWSSGILSLRSPGNRTGNDNLNTTGYLKDATINMTGGTLEHVGKIGVKGTTTFTVNNATVPEGAKLYLSETDAQLTLTTGCGITVESGVQDYYVKAVPGSGTTTYTLTNEPIVVNDGSITVAAEITDDVVEMINDAIVNNNATSVDLTAATTKEITGLEIPANCLNCLVIVNNGTTVKDGSNENIENNVVVKNGENYSCEKLVLTDKVPFKAPVGFTAASITHERKTSSTSAVWGTACLPYPVKSVSGDDGIRYYQLSESNSKEGVMSFTLITDEIAANTPVVFIKSSGAEFNFNSTGKRVAITPANPESSEIQGKTLVGTFAGSNDVATDDSKNYYYISGNKFWHATGTLKVSPFRAYFTETKDGQSVRNYTLQVVDDGNVTRIDSVEGFDMSDEQVYTLDGKKVNNVKKGSIYIIGGNKVVIK